MSNAFFYAQIDANNVVIGVSQLAGEVIEPHMISIASYDQSLLGSVHQADGTFVKPTPPAPTLADVKAARIAALENDCYKSLQAFTSAALGTKHTYLSRNDAVNNDWALFNGEFSFVTGAYFDNQPIQWYTEENGVLLHTKEQFIQLYLNARTSVALRKQQAGTLTGKVQSYVATTSLTTDTANINAIVWSDPWAAAPSVPTGLAGTAGAAGSGQVTLNWTASTDATMSNGGGYNVYVDGAATAVNTTLIAGTTDALTGLAVGSHTFQITAVGANGVESAKCAAITVTVS